ncbi:hypothetical protein ABIA39_005126 [Nocardia sp. GAS34]|uniref:hypothetical protein n=1 Tax=unclassified Nocardia TaxID=2637762 RepID=UPI003D229677
MQLPTCLSAGITAAGIAAAGITATGAASAAPPARSQPPTSVAQDAAPVPPGALITSFLHNQVVYCSIICPLLIQTGVTASDTALRAPGTFRTALQSNDTAHAIGVTAASITGPTNAAAEKSILADGTEVAPRALNAFEVGVVGLLNVAPAAQGASPALAVAAETARRDTYTALNRPIVPNPVPTVRPHGVGQVAVVGAINVGAAIAFPAFNDILSSGFQAPDAAARTLAATGDPARAVAAGVTTEFAAQTAARTVIADTIAREGDKIRAAAAQSPPTGPIWGIVPSR